MKNVSIKKRVRKNNNNKKYNKTQTKRSRRNKTQRNNRRRRNFRNKTRRGGVSSHGPSPLRQGINADGSAVRRADGFRAARKSSRAPTNPVAKKAAANLGLSVPTSKRRGIKIPPLDMSISSRKQSSYNPAEIDIDKVEDEIIEEIKQINNKISPLVSDIKKLEDDNNKLQGEINGTSYLEASAEEKSIINARVGQQVGENYSEIERRKSEIDRLKSLIKNNEYTMNKLQQNIDKIINDSKLSKKEYEANTPHGIIMKKMMNLGPGDKESWKFFFIENLPILAPYIYTYPTRESNFK